MSRAGAFLAAVGPERPLLVVLRALGLGDLLCAVPALAALRAGFPAHRIVLATPRALAPLALLTGAVDEVVDAAPLAPLPRSLHGADVGVALHGSGPESHRALLATRPRRLIAFANADVPESGGGPAWDASEHEVRRWCRLVQAAGIDVDPSRLRLPVPAIPPPAGAVGATLIHPGAASEARRWPAERWAAVAEAEHACGRRVAITGSRSELDLARRVARRAGLPAGAVLAGRTSVLELASAVAAAAVVACADTGIAHLATALGRPSVVLFGPTPPALWGPPPLDRHRVLWRGRPGDPHAPTPSPGLLEIGADEVCAAIAEQRAAVAAA